MTYPVSTAAAQGPAVYSDFIKTLIDEEATRKASIETKGVAAITTSSALVTILFALVAVVTKSTTFVLPAPAHGWLVAAIIAFVATAAIAIVVSFPLPYGQTLLTVDQLSEWWNDDGPTAEAAVAGVRLQALSAARRMNAIKVALLCSACLAELAGLVFLAGAVVRIITN